MKKSSIALIVIILLVVLGGAGYALFHKSNKSTTSSSTASSGTSSAPAVNNAVLVTKTSSSLGKYLAEPNGQALYTYGGDTSGVSNCSGTCLANWPAYQDKGSTSNLPAGVSTIKRPDNGQTQYTYNGMPLYTFAADSTGQVTGNGVSNFSVAVPAAASSSSSSSNNQSSGTSTTPTDSSDSSGGYNYN